MISHKAIPAGLAALVLACGGILLSSVPASASVVHRYERQFSGGATPAGSFVPDGVAIDDTCHFAGLSGGACTSFDPSSGDVYVADEGHGVVDKFTSSGVYQSQLTGPTGGSFGHPRGVTVDQSNGDVYVADESHGVVDKFSPAGAYLCQITGAGSATTSNSECDSSEPGVPGGSLANPVAVAVAQLTGAVYVALNDREGVVDKFNASGGYVSQLTGDPSGAFIYPQGVAFDDTCHLLGLSGSACTSFDPASGDVYVDDSREHGPLDKFDSAGDYVSQLTSLRYGGGPIAVDQSRGDIYIVNNAGGFPSEERIEEFDSSGARQSEIYGNALPSGANAFRPSSVAAEASTGDVYIADRGNHVVDVFGPNIKGPEAFTGGFLNPLATSVTLDGEVNPQGNDTTSLFEYGPCAAATCSPGDPYSSKQATIPADNGSGVVKVPVEVSLTGLVPNQAYHYQLVAANSVNQSPPGGEREFRTLAVPPQAQTLAPVLVGFAAADLSATVNPEHSETTYWLEYGACETPAACESGVYGNRTPAQQSASYGVLSVTHEIEGLQPATAYHYRLVAENSAAPAVLGENVTFTTAPAPALSVVSSMATGVTQTAAVLWGTVNPNGLASSYAVQIGTEAGVYGPEVGFGGIGPGIYEPVTVTLALQDLQPGTTYHYRLVASNAYDTAVYGADQTFTTVGAPSPFAQPFALPLIAVPTIAFPAEPNGSGSRPTKPVVKCKRSKRGTCLKSKRKTKGRRKAHGKKR